MYSEGNVIIPVRNPGLAALPLAIAVRTPRSRFARVAPFFCHKFMPALPQQIRFCASHDGMRIAYATSGSGPPLVKAANWVSHLEFGGSREDASRSRHDDQARRARVGPAESGVPTIFHDAIHSRRNPGAASVVQRTRAPFHVAGERGPVHARGPRD